MIRRLKTWQNAVPRFWRLILGTIASVAVLMVVVIFDTRLTPNDYGCLYLDGQEIGLLDIHSEKFIQNPILTRDPTHPNKLAYDFASDRKQLAYLKTAGADGLVIQNLSRPIPAGGEVSAQ